MDIIEKVARNENTKIRLNSGKYRVFLEGCKTLTFISDKADAKVVVEIFGSLDEMIVSSVSMNIVSSNFSCSKITLKSARLNVEESIIENLVHIIERSNSCFIYNNKENGLVLRDSIELYSSNFRLNNSSLKAGGFKLKSGSRIFIESINKTPISIFTSSIEKDKGSFVVLPSSMEFVKVEGIKLN